MAAPSSSSAFLFGDDGDDSDGHADAPSLLAAPLLITATAQRRLVAKETLRVSQKRGVLAARAPLTELALKPLLAVVTAARPRLDPTRVVRHFVVTQCLLVDAAAVDVLGGPGMLALDGEAAAEADALLAQPALKKAAKAVFAWIKRTAHTAGWRRPGAPAIQGVALDRRKGPPQRDDGDGDGAADRDEVLVACNIEDGAVVASTVTTTTTRATGPSWRPTSSGGTRAPCPTR